MPWEAKILVLLMIFSSGPHIPDMSRAFVKDTDADAVEDLPDRPVSEYPNDVTAEGLAQIEAAVVAAQAAHSAAQEVGDRAAMAQASRDLRYWSAGAPRLASCRMRMTPRRSVLAAR